MPFTTGVEMTEMSSRTKDMRRRIERGVAGRNMTTAVLQVLLLGGRSDNIDVYVRLSRSHTSHVVKSQEVVEIGEGHYE